MACDEQALAQFSIASKIMTIPRQTPERGQIEIVLQGGSPPLEQNNTTGTSRFKNQWKSMEISSKLI